MDQRKLEENSVENENDVEIEIVVVEIDKLLDRLEGVLEGVEKIVRRWRKRHQGGKRLGGEENTERN